MAEIVYGFLLTKSFFRSHWGKTFNTSDRSSDASDDEVLDRSSDASDDEVLDRSSDASDDENSVDFDVSNLVYDRTKYHLYDVDFAYSTTPSTKHDGQRVIVIGIRLVSMEYHYSGVMMMPENPPVSELDKLCQDNPSLRHLIPRVYVVCDSGK